MSSTEANTSAVGPNGNPGGSETGVRRGRNTRGEIPHEHEVEIELMEGEPTIQQRQAYEQFWKLFFERAIRERRPDKIP